MSDSTFHREHQEANEFNRVWYPELPLCYCQECIERRGNLYDLEQSMKAMEYSAEVRAELKENMHDENYPFSGFLDEYVPANWKEIAGLE